MNTLILLFATILGLTSAQLYLYEAGTNGKQGPMLEDRFKFCPSMYSNGVSIECKLPAGTKGADIYLNGNKKVERYPPFFAAGNRGNMVYEIKGLKTGSLKVECMGGGKTYTATGTVSCEMKEEGMPKMEKEPEMKPKEEQKMKEVTPKKGNFCVYKKGSDIVGSIPSGWVKRGFGLEYKPNDDFRGALRNPKTSVLTYKFQVKYESTYAVSVDMGTKGSTEHNDVFIRCEGGLSGRRKESVIKPDDIDGFVKGYHNDNGRAIKAFNKDHDPHALSTVKVLKPGMTYTCEIGARSTKTTVYGLVLFPCTGRECSADSPVWKTGVNTCKA